MAGLQELGRGRQMDQRGRKIPASRGAPMVNVTPLYRCPIPNVPTYCGYIKRNSVDHFLDCKLGGHVHIYHNNFRDTQVKITREVAYNVKVEPGLQN